MRRRIRLGYSTYYNADLNIKKFGKFLEDRIGIGTLYIRDLSVDMFNNYILYRKDTLGNTSNEGINKALVPLYKAVKYAADNGLMEKGLATSISTNYIEKKTRSYSGETDEEKVRYLTDTQFRDLLDVYDRTRNEATRKIMDMFLFSYYVCGLRYSDLLTLEWRHIDFGNRTLTKNVYKTKRSIITAARGQGHRDPAQVAKDRRQQPFRVQPARRGIRPVGHRQAEQRKIDKGQEHPAVAQKRRDKDGVKIQPDDTRGQTHIRRTGLEERDGRAHDKPPDRPFVKPCHREGLCRVPAGHNQHDRPRAA